MLEDGVSWRFLGAKRCFLLSFQSHCFVKRCFEWCFKVIPSKETPPKSRRFESTHFVNKKEKLYKDPFKKMKLDASRF